MHVREKKESKTKSLIERIFSDVVQRDMTPKERRVLLTKSKETRKRK